jgi:hypothetical protein
MLLRRFMIIALSAVAVLAAAPAATATSPAAAADGTAIGPPLVPPRHDRLTITVSRTDERARKRVSVLLCHPTGGTHPVARDACNRLDEVTRWGKDPFAPVPPGTNCTMLYGGPATARITGRWAGRPVNAVFNRRNGCEVSRWDRLRPVLPGPRS